MTEFTLSRGSLRDATGWRYHRVQALIVTPYMLERCLDASGHRGGGRTERFRLGDILPRLKIHKNFTPEMERQLIAADAAYRKGNNK